MLKFFRSSLRHSACLLLVSATPTSLPLLFFLLSDSRNLVFSSNLPFYLNLSGRSGRHCLYSPTVPSGYNGSADTRFSRVTTQLMSWPDGKRYLCHLQSLVVSLLLFFVSIIIFSRTGCVLSHRNSSTNRLHRFPLKNLCSLVFAGTDTAYC